jgi:plastocyanin
MLRARIAGGIAGAVLMTAVAGCGSSSSGASGNAVSIVNFNFQPSGLTVAAGTAVTWTNTTTDTTHTTTSNDGVWDSGHLDPGKTFSFTFTRAGTFAFHCNIHPSMTGTITVT